MLTAVRPVHSASIGKVGVKGDLQMNERRQGTSILPPPCPTQSHVEAALLQLCVFVRNLISAFSTIANITSNANFEYGSICRLQSWNIALCFLLSQYSVGVPIISRSYCISQICGPSESPVPRSTQLIRKSRAREVEELRPSIGFSVKFKGSLDNYIHIYYKNMQEYKHTLNKVNEDV